MTITSLPSDSAAPPRLPRTLLERDTAARVIVVLADAPLEIARVGRQADAKYVLLSGDDHQSLLKKHGKDPADYRPDITHQCLLTLLDSPLNKAGRLQVYIHTRKNVLIQVNPKTRLPRTYVRFAGLMVQVLHKLSVRSQGTGGEVLLNVIKNPVTDHLPTRCVRVGCSGDAGKAVRLREWARERVLPTGLPVVFWVGAVAHGKDVFPEAEMAVSVSDYALSASVVCGKICEAFEELWDIL